MKADPGQQRRLLDLAETDAELNRINHRRRTLPELEEITAAEQDLRTKRDALVATQTSLSDIEGEVRRLESEVDQVRARETRDRKLMDETVSAKQAEDLQHELDTLTRRQSVLEDELLEIMERREALQRDETVGSDEVDKAEQHLADVQQRRDEALKDLDTAEANRTAERKTVIEELDAELIKLYERLREQKGIGAALLRSSRCGACRLDLDRVVLEKVRNAPADEVLRCEECGAIMVRQGSAG